MRIFFLKQIRTKTSSRQPIGCARLLINARAFRCGGGGERAETARLCSASAPRAFLPKGRFDATRLIDGPRRSLCPSPVARGVTAASDRNSASRGTRRDAARSFRFDRLYGRPCTAAGRASDFRGGESNTISLPFTVLGYSLRRVRNEGDGNRPLTEFWGGRPRWARGDSRRRLARPPWVGPWRVRAFGVANRAEALVAVRVRQLGEKSSGHRSNVCSDGWEVHGVPDCRVSDEPRCKTLCRRFELPPAVGG